LGKFVLENSDVFRDIDLSFMGQLLRLLLDGLVQELVDVVVREERFGRLCTGTAFTRGCTGTVCVRCGCSACRGSRLSISSVSQWLG